MLHVDVGTEPIPEAFVLWPNVINVLHQGNGDGVVSTTLMKQDGASLAVATVPGFDESSLVVGALVANIWNAYERGARELYAPPRHGNEYGGYDDEESEPEDSYGNEDSLDGAMQYHAGDFQYLIVDCVGGQIAVAPVCRFLLCLQVDQDTDAGLLKAKLLTLTNYMREPLQRLYPSLYPPPMNKGDDAATASTGGGGGGDDAQGGSGGSSGSSSSSSSSSSGSSSSGGGGGGGDDDGGQGSDGGGGGGDQD